MGESRLAAAGRIHSRGNAQRAFRAARLLETTILSSSVPTESDRHAALSTIWEHIYGIDGCDLGPDNGDDLVILFVVADSYGTGISGVGLGGVWSLSDQQFDALVVGNHPLLSGPGRPERLAGVLTLDNPTETVVAVPHDHRTPTPLPRDWKQRCGVNR